MMQSLGLLAIPAARASAVALPENSGKGKSVVILGAGIAGMVAAWELQESRLYLHDSGSAQSRRRPQLDDSQRHARRNDRRHHGNLQIRRRPLFQCRPGPLAVAAPHDSWLLPRIWRPLEVEVNSSRSSLLQCDSLNGGKPVEQRQVMNDTRGHVAELLAKVAEQTSPRRRSDQRRQRTHAGVSAQVRRSLSRQFL